MFKNPDQKLFLAFDIEWVSIDCRVISQLLWFCIATVPDWLKNLAPLSRPIRSKTKTNRDLPVRVFPRLAPATCICFSSDWFTGLFTTDVTGESDYFGFGFTTLK